MKNVTICIIAWLTGDRVGTRAIADTLIANLSPSGFKFIAASRHRRPDARVVDIISTMIRHRRQYQAVLVSVFSGRAFYWAELAGHLAKFMNKRLVLWLHGGLLPEFYKRPSARKRVDQLFKKADRIVAPSRYLAAAFESAGHAVEVTPHALPIIGQYLFRQRVSCRPRLMWLRAFHPIYNPLLAVRTVALLRQTYPDIQLLMCGPVNDQATLAAVRNEASRLGVEGSIELPGPISKERIKQEGCEYDILLNTPVIDNTPVSVIESLAMGMCVVSTNVGGIPYLLEHEHNALLVPSDNPEEMATAVRRILTEPELAGRLSHNARLKAEQFDSSVVLPQWEELLASVAEGCTTSVTVN